MLDKRGVPYVDSTRPDYRDAGYRVHRLVRQIATLHGGNAWAESAPGEWARFSLSLPRQSALS
ncbi:MAG: HAMP domain-containing histidine kinase [Deltaproteobacteria bacterium]|nr:HAMP domain-containing histidine kinase [Deltaproteobacteria bacterium]